MTNVAEKYEYNIKEPNARRAIMRGTEGEKRIRTDDTFKWNDGGLFKPLPKNKIDLQPDDKCQGFVGRGWRNGIYKKEGEVRCSTPDDMIQGLSMEQ